MSHFSRSLLLSAAAFALPLTLAACGSNEASEEELAKLDDNLTSDPAMNDALEDAILVDPDLTDQVKTGEPLPRQRLAERFLLRQSPDR